MLRDYVSRLVLALLLTSVLTAVPRVQPISSIGTIYIKADGSIEPPTAPISTVDNVTYVFAGNISDSIVIERDNILVDGKGYILQGSGGGSGIDISHRNNVTIKNTTVIGFSTGIKSFSSSNNTISQSTITENDLYAGIDFLDSSNCTVSENNITAHTRYGMCGISLHRSSGILISGNNITDNGSGVEVKYDSLDNSILNNEITNNGEGIMIIDSSDNAVSGNNFTRNGVGISLDSSSNIRVAGNKFYADGLFVWGAYGNDVMDNLINDRPLVYLEDVSDRIVNDAGQVILVKCSNIFVQNLDLSNTSAAVQLWGTNNTEIANNNMIDNGRGLGLHESSNITVCRNNIADNSDGIYLSFSSNITVAENKIANNSFGIDTYISSNITVAENKIANNSFGIQFGPSSGNNTIYHNSFIDNGQVSSSEVVNAWDDDYPSGGNYWSDYTGTDLLNGPYQNETGSDGIGDAPYIIDENNTDRYPLMNPWGRLEPKTWTVDDDGPADFHIIQEAINAAGEGDTVSIRAGVYCEEILVNKSISLVGEDRETTIICGNMSSYALTIGVENVSIASVAVTNASTGILIGANSPFIHDVKVSGNYVGVWASESLNGTIRDSVIVDQIAYHGEYENFGGAGIGLDQCGLYNILNNSISNNEAIGIWIRGGFIRTEGNRLNENGAGLELDWAANCTVIKNFFSDNMYGVEVSEASNCSVCANNFTGNTYWAIELGGSTGILIYHNSFVNDTIRAYSTNSNSFWDNGCEGNFWSNYNGTDADNDGVGDTYLPWEGVDNYPLLNVYWNPCDVNHDLKVDMRDIGVSAKAFGTVSGDALWNPHSDITGPEPLIADWKVDMRDVGLVARHFGEHYS